MGKPTICICENKDADQLCGNREADQRLCFRFTDSTLSLLFKSEISSFQPVSVAVQPSLCRTSLKTTLLVFPRGGSIIVIFTWFPLICNNAVSFLMTWLIHICTTKSLLCSNGFSLLKTNTDFSGYQKRHLTVPITKV